MVQSSGLSIYSKITTQALQLHNKEESFGGGDEVTNGKDIMGEKEVGAEDKYNIFQPF